MNYFRRRKKEKLYRQWVVHAGLPPGVISPSISEPRDVRPQVHNRDAVSPGADNQVATHPDVTGDMIAEVGKDRLRLPLLYLLFGVSLLILCVGLILLIVHSC